MQHLSCQRPNCDEFPYNTLEMSRRPVADLVGRPTLLSAFNAFVIMRTVQIRVMSGTRQSKRQRRPDARSNSQGRFPRL